MQGWNNRSWFFNERLVDLFDGSLDIVSTLFFFFFFVLSLAEKLYNSQGPELRRSLFSLKQLFQVSTRRADFVKLTRWMTTWSMVLKNCRIACFFYYMPTMFNESSLVLALVLVGNICLKVLCNYSYKTFDWWSPHQPCETVVCVRGLLNVPIVG